MAFFFFFFFFFFFYPSLIFNELSSKSHFASFTISSIHVPHVSFSRSRFFNNYFYLCLSHSYPHTQFQYCKSKLYVALGGGDKTLKKKKETLINTPPPPLFSNSHFSFLISFGFKRCS